MRISDWSADVCSSDLFLNLYKLGAGPYYCFYAPFHLCHFEVPNSIARAVLFDDAVLAPASSPVVGVVAVAKKNLNAGETIEEFGGHEAYGVAENYEKRKRVAWGKSVEVRVEYGGRRLMKK